jgi:hypothetical protein
VVLSVDVFEIVKLIGEYQKNSSEDSSFLVATSLLAKLAGGIVLGLCFWLIDPFRDPLARRATRQNPHYDVYGDF